METLDLHSAMIFAITAPLPGWWISLIPTTGQCKINKIGFDYQPCYPKINAHFYAFTKQKTFATVMVIEIMHKIGFLSMVNKLAHANFGFLNLHIFMSNLYRIGFVCLSILASP